MKSYAKRLIKEIEEMVDTNPLGTKGSIKCSICDTKVKLPDGLGAGVFCPTCGENLSPQGEEVDEYPPFTKSGDDEEPYEDETDEEELDDLDLEDDEDEDEEPTEEFDDLDLEDDEDEDEEPTEEVDLEDDEDSDLEDAGDNQNLIDKLKAVS